MSVDTVENKTYFDPTEERELRLHLLTKRRAEITKEQLMIEQEIAELSKTTI